MNYPALEDLLDKADSKYTLAVLAAKRAREIIQGSEMLVDRKSSKPVSIALEEIAKRKITFKRNKTGIK
ncbi:DNA-directed RNA polymerase subunit omega|uniref:DNA-directed RNA polymerase subunit omega n=1 Tax=Dendrosporobacter quercicolus TaxID=146817 RepID=A0A1G9LDT0_9FIRM|nr:DNA-directed RNA polymerase subunit omega [Dendrosporobacter quercicolus]NSL46679.1 DNA-directed RNA polymerase subunit omega [Dendrosporobacter quercicolus DSM 1736]SDL60016.1 DNA-directed RNA polymerase subunit omega [Dendrosporobacter quercicolus]